MSEEKRWGTQELSDYIKDFSSEEKENIVKELVSSKILGDFLNTPQGKVILNSTIDSIRDNTMRIVQLSIEGAEVNCYKISQAALQINIAYKFMHGIASTMSIGEAHEKGMSKK